MKKRLVEIHRAMVVMMVVAIASALLVSCGDDDEINYDNLNYYAVSFGVEGGSSPDLVDEMNLIKNTFYKELGIKEGESSFMLKGAVDKCDSRVLSCCRAAEVQLVGRLWSQRYVFVVNRLVTENGVNKEVLVFTFDTATK